MLVILNQTLVQKYQIIFSLGISGYDFGIKINDVKRCKPNMTDYKNENADVSSYFRKYSPKFSNSPKINKTHFDVLFHEVLKFGQMLKSN